MATPGQELLGEHYEGDHLTYEQIEELRLKVVREDGQTVPEDDLQGKVFRFEDKDEPSGYLVKNMESTGQSTILCYLQAS